MGNKFKELTEVQKTAVTIQAWETWSEQVIQESTSTLRDRTSPTWDNQEAFLAAEKERISAQPKLVETLAETLMNKHKRKAGETFVSKYWHELDEPGCMIR